MAVDSVSSVASAERCGVKVGQLVGNYRIERLIGEGGMGAVFAAVHKDIGRRAAVKVLFRQFAHDPEFATRFMNEARAVNLVSHPGLIEISEFGTLPDATPYIIMEFLQGESLAERMVRRDGLLPQKEILELCRQIALALGAAHDKGVVHRDLKPENIMLLPDPLQSGGLRVKVFDFGIAKLSSGPGVGLTRTGVTLGSPLYMAPEQCLESGRITPRADVYALGIMLYELLCGRPPFVASLPGEVMVMHVKNTPPPLAQLAQGVAAPLVALVHQMISKNPAKRPTMDGVARELARLLSGQPPSGRPRRQRALLWLGVGLALLGALGLFALGRRRLASTAPAPTVSRAPSAEHRRAFDAAAKRTPARVRWSINSEPQGARVIAKDSGEELGQTPMVRELQAAAGLQAVILRRAGYGDLDLLLDRSQDETRSEKLTPLTGSRKPAHDVIKPVF